MWARSTLNCPRQSGSSNCSSALYQSSSLNSHLRTPTLTTLSPPPTLSLPQSQSIREIHTSVSQYERELKFRKVKHEIVGGLPHGERGRRKEIPAPKPERKPSTGIVKDGTPKRVSGPGTGYVDGDRVMRFGGGSARWESKPGEGGGGAKGRRHLESDSLTRAPPQSSPDAVPDGVTLRDGRKGGRKKGRALAEPDTRDAPTQNFYKRSSKKKSKIKLSPFPEDYVPEEPPFVPSSLTYNTSLPMPGHDDVRTFYVLGKHFSPKAKDRLDKRIKTHLEKFQPTTGFFNAIFTILGKFGVKYSEEVEFYYQKMVELNVEQDAKTYSSLIDYFGKVKKLDEVQEFVDKLVLLEPNSTFGYNKLLNVYQQHQMHAAAEEVFLTMKKNGIKPDIITFTSFMCVCRDMRSEEGYTKIIETSQAIAEASILPDIRYWNILLDATVNHFSVPSDVPNPDSQRKVLEVFDSIRDRGLVPDIYSYNCLVNFYASKAPAYLYEDEIEPLLEEMRYNRVPPTNATFNRIIQAFAERGFLPQTQHYFAEMRRCRVKPTIATYSIVIGLYCRKNHASLATKSLTAMMKDDMIKPSLQIFSEVIMLCVRKAEPQYALRVFGNMQKYWPPPQYEVSLNMYNLLLKHCANNYNHGFAVNKAMKLYDELKLCHRPNTETFTALVELCVRLYNIEALSMYFVEMKEYEIPVNSRIVHFILDLNEHNPKLAEHDRANLVSIKDQINKFVAATKRELREQERRQELQEDDYEYEEEYEEGGGGVGGDEGAYDYEDGEEDHGGDGEPFDYGVERMEKSSMSSLSQAQGVAADGGAEPEL